MAAACSAALAPAWSLPVNSAWIKVEAGGEVPVEGADGHPGVLGDLFQGGFEALLREVCAGSFEQGVAIAQGVTPQWALRGRGRLGRLRSRMPP
jgi:hypothetical protein